MNIVVVVSGGLGETLQAGPLLQALGAAPAATVELACPPAAAELGARLSGVATVRPMAALGHRGRGTWRLWWALRRRRFDVAVVCSQRWSVRGAVYAAAMSRRLGSRGGPSDLLLTDISGAGRHDNRTAAWAALADRLGLQPNHDGGPSLVLDAAADRAAEQRLMSTGAGDGRLLVAIVPGRGHREGRPEEWTPERWAHLANRLSLRHGAAIVLLGDEGDRGLVDALRLDLAQPPIDLVGELDLTETAAVIARCDLLVAGATPLLQLAGAVGTPSVGLFGSSDGHADAWTGPEHRVVQALPAGAGSLDAIRVDDVLAAIEGAA